MSLLESPETWNSESLEDLLVHVIGGDWGKAPDHQEQDYQTVACIRGSEFRNWTKESGRTAVSRKVKANSLDKRSLLPGDILLEISGGGPDQPVGRTVLINQAVLNQFDTPVIGTNFLRLLRPSAALDQRFLNKYLEFFYSSGEVVRYQGGSNNLRNLKFKEYSQISVPVPPLAEQKVIADKLDTLLAQVENTKARLERILQILKHFRQSVLAAAVSGRLTEEWRKFHSSLFPYENCQLSEIIHEMRNGLSPKPNEQGRGQPILRISSVRPFFLDQVDIRYLEVSKKDQERYSLKLDDLLVTRYNGSLEFVGVCARVSQLDHDVLLYPDKLIRVRVEKNKVTPKFLEIFAASHEAREYIYSLVKSTSGQKGISGKDLKLMKVQLPSIREQTEIVRQVDQLFAHADRIEQQVDNALTRVNRLTQSILAKAFRGELTEQWRKDNPELISGENSAEALLARIKAERAAKSVKTTGKRKITA